MSIMDSSKFRAASDEASCDMLKPAIGSSPLSSPLIPRRQMKGFIEQIGDDE